MRVVFEELYYAENNHKIADKKGGLSRNFTEELC